MKIALFGARGMVGQRIAAEARSRGHEITALGKETDVTDAPTVARAVAGHDAVVSAVGPGLGASAAPVEMLPRSAQGLLGGLRLAGVKRLLVVGGAGSLEVAPGKQLVDQPDFPEAWKPVALAHREALGVLRADPGRDVDWTYVSPPALIEPGARTGKYRTGKDQLLTDEGGLSRISAEDYAVAVLDELEEPRSVRQRMTVAY